MKLGLITIYHVPNYGSVLQTYATQELLRSFGHDVRVIRYNYFNERYYEEAGHTQSLRERLYFLKPLLMPFSKAAVLQRFRNKYLNFTDLFNSIEELNKYDWEDYDAFIVGSDQVWNTKFLFGDPGFLLSFVPESKKRISLSSSFATKTVCNKYEKVFKRELSKFAAISVREQNGVDIIHSQLGVDLPVVVTLDPTLLLDNKQWITLFPLNCKKQHSKPYILYYMWAYAFEPRPYIFEVVKYYQQKLGYDVVALEGIRESKGYKDIHFIDADNSTIPEFIELFNNAALVITSSFHGTAFAINFGVPLVSIVPNNAGDDRQTTLLKACGADSSIIKINTEISTINPTYDVNKVKARLDRIRQASIQWIKDNINEY